MNVLVRLALMSTIQISNMFCDGALNFMSTLLSNNIATLQQPAKLSVICMSIQSTRILMLHNVLCRPIQLSAQNRPTVQLVYNYLL